MSRLSNGGTHHVDEVLESQKRFHVAAIGKMIGHLLATLEAAAVWPAPGDPSEGLLKSQL